jgi:hypothetical protein
MELLVLELVVVVLAQLEETLLAVLEEVLVTDFNRPGLTLQLGLQVVVLVLTVAQLVAKEEPQLETQELLILELVALRVVELTDLVVLVLFS